MYDLCIVLIFIDVLFMHLYYVLFLCIIILCIILALYCTLKIKNVFYLCVCFLCIICVKSMINILQYITIEPIVLVAYLE